MKDWIDVTTTDSLKPGHSKLIEINGVIVVVVNIEGNYYAFEDICTHDGGTLSDGEIVGCEIICPRHGARFDMRTGEVTAPPAYEALPTYQVRVQGGRVQLCSGQKN